MPKTPHRRATNRFVDPRAHHRERSNAAAGTLLAIPAVSLGVWVKRAPKIVALVLAVVTIGVLFSYFNSDQFFVFAPELRGIKYVTSAEVIQASGVIGYNIFFVETRGIEKALGKIPEVKSVHVVSSVPSRVLITVQEREPKLVWQRGGESYWVDEDGVAVPVKASLPNLPILRDLDQNPIKIGQKTPAEGTTAAIALRKNWKDAPRVLEWSNARGLSFTDERGWKIYMGDASDMAGKMTKYRACVAMLLGQQAQIRFIDLGKGDPYYQ